MWQYAIEARNCEALKLLAIPSLKPGCRFRLTETAFAGKFPKANPEENVFTIVGPLSNPLMVQVKGVPEASSRTINCQIVWVADGALGFHANKIRVRWLGEEGNYKAERILYVLEDEIIAEGAS